MSKFGYLTKAAGRVKSVPLVLFPFAMQIGESLGEVAEGVKRGWKIEN